jgi:signal transduction histidine kinase
LVQRQAELDNISFSKSYADNLPPVKGNSNDLQQVFINLIKNARDAMPQGGRIGVSTNGLLEEGDEFICVHISDTGPGVSPVVADRVFESFFTTKERGKGTGLGLAVSKRIVKEHGGRIGFTNSRGGGAVFWVILPVAVGAECGDFDE